MMIYEVHGIPCLMLQCLSIYKEFSLSKFIYKEEIRVGIFRKNKFITFCLEDEKSSSTKDYILINDDAEKYQLEIERLIGNFLS